MNSRTITVEIECEVFWEPIVDKSFGEDADGNRGCTVIERRPTSVQVLELGVPEVVQGWLKARALEAFEHRYNT